MTSSRTPEGSPQNCPLCGQFVQIEPSLPTGDAPCPHCGHLLWFVVIPKQPVILFDGEMDDVRERVLRILADRLSVSVEALRKDPALLQRLGVDSLDTVELVLELEEEVG